MKNEKARERRRLVYEFGLLLQPFEELANKERPPSPLDYRIAVSKVRAGIGTWKARVRRHARFGPELVFSAQAAEIGSRIPSGVINLVEMRLKKTPDDEIADLQSALRVKLGRAREDFFAQLDLIPVEWEPVISKANTPFTSYLHILDVVSSSRERLHYFDRYLKADFFGLYLDGIEADISVRLVSTGSGIEEVKAVSNLFRKEHPDYQLIRVDPHDLHDRNLRVDNRIFSLGPGVDRAGFAPTNFGPSDGSSEAHAALDGIIRSGTIVDSSDW